MDAPQGSPQTLLENVIAKSDRAREHIDTLYDELSDWAKRDPYTFSSEPKGASREHRVYIRFDPTPNPQRWGLLFGDAVHNLRSALDHLIYTLAVRVTNRTLPPGRRKLEFPILDDPDHWRGPKDRRLRSLTDDMRALVESVQPYKASPDKPHRNLLSILRELDNADKHRTITLFGFLASGLVWNMSRVTEGEVNVSYHPFLLEDEAAVITVTGKAVTQMEDDFRSPTLDLLVDTPIGPVEVTYLTGELFQHVSSVVSEFEQFF